MINNEWPSFIHKLNWRDCFCIHTTYQLKALLYLTFPEHNWKVCIFNMVKLVYYWSILSLILYMILEKALISLFSHVAVQFSQHHFLIVFSCLPCLRLTVRCVFIAGLSDLDPWSVFLFLFQYHAIMVFWLLKLCSIVWSQGVWLLQPHFYFSKLLWLFGIFCVSI